MKKYIKKIEDSFKFIDRKIEEIMHLTEKGLDAFFHALKKPLTIFDKASSSFMEKMYSVYKEVDRPLRYLGLPWSPVIVVIKKQLDKLGYQDLPIFVQGTHMVRARVGGGKSLTSLVLAEMTLQATGRASYFTSAVEKPKLSEDGTYYYVMHRVIDLKDYYKDGKKVMNFNTDLYRNLHKDERHLQYNPRLNKSKEYNATFIPEHEDELLMRHDGFETIVKYSQHMKLDAQDMDSLTFMHEVQTIKDIPIKRWLDDGKFNYIPIKLVFYTYNIYVHFDGRMERVLYKKWSLPVPYEVLERFNTHAEQYKYSHLKVDYQ